MEVVLLESPITYLILKTVIVESLLLPVELNLIAVLAVLFISRTEMRIFPAGLLIHPDRDTDSITAAPAVRVTLDAMILVPSHSFA